MTSAWSRFSTFRSCTRNELVKTWLGAQWGGLVLVEEAEDEQETSMMTARLMISKMMERGDVVDVADALAEREVTWTMADLVQSPDVATPLLWLMGSLQRHLRFLRGPLHLPHSSLRSTGTCALSRWPFFPICTRSRSLGFSLQLARIITVRIAIKTLGKSLFMSS